MWPAFVEKPSFSAIWGRSGGWVKPARDSNISRSIWRRGACSFMEISERVNTELLPLILFFGNGIYQKTSYFWKFQINTAQYVPASETNKAVSRMCPSTNW